jgi:hypothetical protein
MMVSTTPSCRRPDRTRWVAALLALWCGLVFSAEGIHVKSADLTANAGEYYLEANFEVGLTHTLEEALNKGVPLHFVVEFELIRPRWYTLYLWNRSVVELEQQYRLSYNALTRQYRLSVGGLHQNLDTLDEALALLGRLRPRLVAPADVLEAGTVYDAAIRMRLDLSQLPKPFQINALGSRDWNLSSEWYRWTVAP